MAYPEQSELFYAYAGVFIFRSCKNKFTWQNRYTKIEKSVFIVYHTNHNGFTLSNRTVTSVGSSYPNDYQNNIHFSIYKS